MLFAAIDQALYMPVAVIIAAMITSSAMIFVAIYNKRPAKNTDSQTPTQNLKSDRWMMLLEIITPAILLFLSSWRLWAILSGSSPVIRSTVFGIVVFTGIGFTCAVFLFVKLAFYLAVKKMWKEKPNLSKQ
jgi:magnesium-transporting ATPase (P-type)